jgi:transcriptional regulator with GAF, ATPase, and Fis domain
MDVGLQKLNAESLIEQYQALLEVSEAIAAHRDTAALFRALAELLRRVIQFDFIFVTLHDPAYNCMRLPLIEIAIPLKVELPDELPIETTPLRERREDIPLLVRAFAHRFAHRMKKSIERIPTETMTALTQYHWPGNVRELENLIERAVILSPGPELEISITELKPAASAPAEKSSALTLEAAEREHILRVLRETDWVVSGPAGAAARLGMNRSTLQSRMRKLGIARPK